MTVRVLMTADPVGGVWAYATELIGALAPLGVDVVLATMGAPLSSAQHAAVRALPNLELAETRLAPEWMPEPWRDVDAAGDWLLGLAARWSPDVVHVNGYAHAALPFGCPVISVAHSCVWTWTRAVRGGEPGPEWAEYRRRVARGLGAATAIVAPSATILAAVLAAYGVARPGRVIANGRSAAAWRPADKQAFVLAAGTLWDEAQGLAALAEAAPRLAWPVCVAGPTVAPADGQPVAAPGVELLGELAPEALAACMARASIYALPARYEPSGLSILEAALAGCALAIGNLDSLRELWGNDACYVPPGDPDALAVALRLLIADPIRRGVLAAAARKRALALTPERMAEAYHALYDEVRA